MNPYQVMAIIVGCTVVFAGVVTTLTMHGVPLLVAFLSVYLMAVWFMIGLQKRAREFYEGKDNAAQRHYDRKTAARRVRIKDLQANEEDVMGQNHLHA